MSPLARSSASHTPSHKGAVRPRRRDAMANRQALFTAAQDLLAVDYHASSDAIANAAGLSRRSFYGHFPDRDKLLREIVSEAAQRFAKIAVSSDEDARVALAVLVAGLCRNVRIARAAWSIAHHEAYREETQQAFAPLRTHLASIIESGINQGVFRSDLESTTLIFLVEEITRAALRGLNVATPEGLRSAVSAALSVAGLSWEEQGELLTAHLEILSSTD